MIPRTLLRIKWGVAYANSLDLAYPVDDAKVWCEPKGTVSSMRMRVAGGEEAAWDDGNYDYFVHFKVRYINPSTAVLLGPVAGTFNAVNGWKDLLLWLWQGNDCRLYPDRVGAPVAYQQAWVEKPLSGDGITLEKNNTRSIDFVFRGLSEFTGY